jgi:iron-sulfur cluster assembly protein
MLTITENAQAVVQGLTDDSQLPDGAGVRIAFAEGAANQLELSVVPDRQPTDVVVEAGEATVFLAEDAAPALDGQTLDAAQTEQGVGFTITPQG